MKKVFEVFELGMPSILYYQSSNHYESYKTRPVWLATMPQGHSDAKVRDEFGRVSIRENSKVP